MITYHVFPRTNLSTNPTSAAYLWQSIMHTIITGGYSPPFQGSMCWCRQRRVPPILLLRAWRIARSIEPSVPGDVRCSTGKSPFYSKRNATLSAHSPAFHHFNALKWFSQEQKLRTRQHCMTVHSHLEPLTAPPSDEVDQANVQLIWELSHVQTRHRWTSVEQQLKWPWKGKLLSCVGSWLASILFLGQPSGRQTWPSNCSDSL